MDLKLGAMNETDLEGRGQLIAQFEQGFAFLLIFQSLSFFNQFNFSSCCLGTRLQHGPSVVPLLDTLIADCCQLCRHPDYAEFPVGCAGKHQKDRSW